MNARFCRRMLAAAFALLPAAVPALDWKTVSNYDDEAPGGEAGAVFRSYNQPSLDAHGVVVFRGRSRVPQGGSQVDGIYLYDADGLGATTRLLLRGDPVPAPNNTDYQGAPAAFTEFPSLPRIDFDSGMVVTRGQHEPAWTYLLGETETRVGTAGIYAVPADDPARTAASLLGAAVEPDQVTLSFPWFSVPGAVFGTRFDQFPGAPTITDGSIVVFKGNYTDPTTGDGKTGVYFRDVGTPLFESYTGLIANSDTRIPNQPAGSDVPFGSTAPPSAANGFVFFTGLDNEDAPTLGGIYRAELAPQPTLQLVAGIGDPVPGAPSGYVFNGFGEGLSVSSDGSAVAFYGRWGSETFSKTLVCPSDGNQDLIAYCLQQYPDGYTVQIPVHQGLFVADLATGVVYPMVHTGRDGIEDLNFWVFSGRPPNVGGGDDGTLESARWRSSAFVALSDTDGALQIAFKARRNGRDGLYARDVDFVPPPLRTIAEVGTTTGTELDPQAPAGSIINTVGIERDGFRRGRVAIAASMLYVDPLDPDASLSWAGLYLTELPVERVFRDSFELQP